MEGGGGRQITNDCFVVEMWIGVCTYRKGSSVGTDTSVSQLLTVYTTKCMISFISKFTDDTPVRALAFTFRNNLRHMAMCTMKVYINIQ